MGAKIASELNIDVSTTDKFSLCVNFGDISKTEVKWESLEEGLAKSKAKIDHEIFKELAQKKRTTLCIVLESLACTKDSALSEEADLEGTQKAIRINRECVYILYGFLYVFMIFYKLL